MKVRFKPSALEALILVFVYLPSYIAVSWYSAENTPMLLDNLMYRERYEAVTISNLPFGVELVTAIFMYAGSKIGLTYYQFLFVKSMSWLFVIYRLYAATRKRRVVAALVLASFLVPSFHDITSFLLRQSFAFEFFILAATSRSKVAKYAFAGLMFFSQISSIIWLPFLFLRPGVLVRRSVLLVLLVLAPVSMFSGFSLGSQVIAAGTSLIGYAGIFAANLQTKVGFYDSVGLASAGGGASFKNMAAMILSAVALLVVAPRWIRGVPEGVLRILDVQIFASLAFFLLFGNQILSNRFGYAAYFISGLFIALALFACWPRVCAMFGMRIETSQ